MCYYSQTDLKYTNFFSTIYLCQMIGFTNTIRDSQRLVQLGAFVPEFFKHRCHMISSKNAFGYKCYISAPGVKSHKIFKTRKLM